MDDPFCPSQPSRRGSSRVTVSIAATLSWSGRSSEVTILNLGPNGLYAYGSQLPRVGELVQIHAPYKSRTIVLTGTVRWVNEHNGFGLQFELLGARETHTVTELMRAAHAPAPAGTKPWRVPVRSG